MAGRHNFVNAVERRRTDAKERQAASDKLTLEQKVARSRPGSREHAKYTYALANKKK